MIHAFQRSVRFKAAVLHIKPCGWWDWCGSPQLHGCARGHTRISQWSSNSADLHACTAARQATWHCVPDSFDTVMPVLLLVSFCWSRCRRVDLLKVDVERAELQVLRGVQRHHWPRIQQLAMEVGTFAPQSSTDTAFCMVSLTPVTRCCLLHDHCIQQALQRCAMVTVLKHDVRDMLHWDAFVHYSSRNLTRRRLAKGHGQELG